MNFKLIDGVHHIKAAVWAFLCYNWPRLLKYFMKESGLKSAEDRKLELFLEMKAKIEAEMKRADNPWYAAFQTHIAHVDLMLCRLNYPSELLERELALQESNKEVRETFGWGDIPIDVQERQLVALAALYYDVEQAAAVAVSD